MIGRHKKIPVNVVNKDGVRIETISRNLIESFIARGTKKNKKRMTNKRNKSNKKATFKKSR